jgi:hypothetical protein
MSWRSPQHRAARSPGRPGGSPGQPNGCNGDSGPGAPPSEMPRFSRQDQLSSAADELILDMLLDGVSPPPDAPAETAALLPMLADLSGPAEPGELGVEAAVLSRFRSRVRPAAISGITSRPSRRTSPRRRLMPHSPRVAAGLAAAAIALGGTAAAYAGALPPALQDFAHHAIDAPAARHASQQRGHGPRHQPGITQTGSASPRHAPQSAAPGTANGHTQPGHGGNTGRAAHPAEPRPSAEPSPRPDRASHPGQSPHASLPPRATRQPRQSHTPQPSQQARAGRPSQQDRFAPNPQPRASQPGKATRNHVPEPRLTPPTGTGGAPQAGTCHRPSRTPPACGTYARQPRRPHPASRPCPRSRGGCWQQP